MVEEYFQGAYVDLKPITIIFPPREEYLIETLNKIYNKIPELRAINEEAKNKIFNTSQLDKYTGLDTNRFVEISIQEHPTISLRKQIKNKYEKGED